MKKVIPALCWAVVILLLACGARFGLVARDSAETMIVVGAVLASIQLSSGRTPGCACFARWGQAR